MVPITNPERHVARDEKVLGRQVARDPVPGGADACPARRRNVASADSRRRKLPANSPRPTASRKDPVRAPRGKIFDREGRLLVDNYPSVSCYLLREQVKDLQADIPLIARWPRSSRRPGPGNHSPLRQPNPGMESILLKQDITPDEQAFIEAHKNELPELETARRTTPPLPARRIRRPPHRVRRQKWLGRRPQHLEVRLLRARRHGRQVRRRGNLRRPPPGHRRIARCHRQ